MRTSSAPSANGAFHLYLADEGGRKLAALWGGTEEKMANGYLWSAAHMLFEGALDAIEALKLLRVGLADNAKVVEVLDAHIDELEYAVAHARGEQP
jgi:hypothetical protein